MKTLVVAPHPDDELLGCGGTLLRRRAEGHKLAWLIVTGISQDSGWTSEQVSKREREIEQVTKLIGFHSVFNLRFPTARLEHLPISQVIGKVAAAFEEFQPTEILLPSPSDVHTDHRVVFDAAVACTKWFRYPSVRRVMSYETVSETEFGLRPEHCFRPNVFVDITDYLESKLQAMAVYGSELGDFPFPRSVEAVRALSAIRGSASGFRAAEAFQLLRERY